MSDQPVIVFASFYPRPGQADEVREVLDGMIGPTRAEEGNEVYDLYRADGDDGPAFHLFERYTGQDALQAHRDSDHYKAYRAAIGDLLAQPIDVVVLAEVDTAS